MKTRRHGGQGKFRFARLFVVLVAVVLISTGLAWGSSDGEAAPKGWTKTDTYRVMNFTVLAVGLFFVLRKPAGQALTGRIQGIKEQLEELEAKKQEAEKQLAQYNERLSLLDKESEQILETYIKQGEEAKEKILAQAQLSAEKLEEKAKRQIDQAFEQARIEVQEQILEKALVKAESMIKEGISAEDQERLVNDYLQKVVA